MYAIVDIETTGGQVISNGITEIAIIIYDGERVVQHFHTLVNPQQAIPSFITNLTGISNAMVASAPTFAEIAENVYELLREMIFVAHNVSFDYSFIYHQLKQEGFILDTQKLCTIKLCRKVFPGLSSYSLGNLCHSLGIAIADRHRAIGDAKATTLVFEKLMRSGADVHFDKMMKRKQR
jgi:DNA polymerase-3 subunit epsilon